MDSAAKYFTFVGRVMLALPFIMSGLIKVPAYTGIVAEITRIGLPFAPLGWALAVFVEVFCSFALLIGFQTRIVAIILALWCIVTAVFFHNNFADQNQSIHFLKNVMMAGGLLQIAYFGAGVLGLDNRRKTA